MKNIFAILLVILIGSSCKKDAVIEIKSEDVRIPSFSNVVILGNSITKAGPDPSIGWNSNCGMAATKPEFDYLHLLTAKLRTINNKVTVTTINAGPFEWEYPTYDYTVDYKPLKDLHPDLIIMRFGENVVQDSPKLKFFDQKYGELIAYFKEGNPDVKILAVGSFWGNPVVDASMKKYSKFTTLTPLLNDISNQAYGIFPNPSVAVHPSDKGMMAIYNIIWDALAEMK